MQQRDFSNWEGARTSTGGGGGGVPPLPHAGYAAASEAKFAWFEVWLTGGIAVAAVAAATAAVAVVHNPKVLVRLQK